MPKRKKICDVTIGAIEDIFFLHDIGTRDDAITLLKERHPNIPEHLEGCQICQSVLDAELFCSASYQLTDQPSLA